MKAALPPVAVRGVLLVLVTAAAARLVSLAGLAVLARLVAPEEFGVLATALAYITYAETVSDLGVGAALIAWPSRRDDAARVTFTVGVALAASWVLLTWLLAPAVAAFFRNPQAEDVLKVLALGFLIKGLGSTHDALCQKELRFGDRLLPELAMAGVKAIVAIGLALAGLGVWSLVLGHLAGLSAWTALLWRLVPWRPRSSWPRGLVAPMLGYGRRVVAVNLLGAVTHHADLVVVGRVAGTAALGFYQMAYKLPEMTIAVVIWAVSRVLVPALSRVRHDPRALGSAYLGALRHLALLTLPAAAAMALLAEPLVLAFFGPRWSPAVPLVRVLAGYMGLRSLSIPAGDFLKATERPGLLAWLGLLKAALLLPALVAASAWGAVAVAAALATVTALTLTFSLGVAVRLTGTGARDTLRALGPGLAAAAVTAIILGLWLSVTPGQPAPLRALLGLLLAGASAVVAVPALSPEAWREVVSGVLGSGAAHSAGGDASPLAALDRFLLPADDVEVASYLRRRMLVPHTLRERVAGELLPTRLLIARRARPVGGPGEGSSLDARRMIARGLGPGGLLWDALPESRSDRRLVWCGDDFERRRRVVVFAFPRAGAEPTVVVRLRCLSGAGPALGAERETLVKLAASLPPDLAATLPRVLAYRSDHELEALALTHVPGRPAYVQMQASLLPGRAVAGHFQAAAEWLARFQAVTRQGSVTLDAEMERASETLARAGLPRAERDALQERLRPLAGVRVPLVACHGDFWARNLLLDERGGVAVVDWEHFRPAALGFADLFHFPLTYGLNYLWSRYRRRSPEDAFRLAFVEATPVARAIGRYLARHCAASGLDPSLLRPLLDLFLASPETREPGAAPPPWLASARLLTSATSAALPT